MIYKFSILALGLALLSCCQSKSETPNTLTNNIMHPEFSKTASTLGLNIVSKPINPPMGFQIIKRNKTEKVYTRHILIMHTDVKNKPPWVKRSKKEAKELAQKLFLDIKEGNAKFADIVKKHSNCPSRQCGDRLKAIGQLELVPNYERTASNLKYWQLSEVIETRFGFHIIQRVPESFALANSHEPNESHEEN